MAELTNAQKKDWAKILFLKENLLQKEIAVKVGVSEKTIGKWKEDDKWDDLRKASFVSKEEHIRRSYIMIDNLMMQIENDYDGVPDAKQADVLAKLAATIRSLETETSIAQITDVGRDFINWLKRQDLAKAQDFIIYIDAFIKHKLKSA